MIDLKNVATSKQVSFSYTGLAGTPRRERTRGIFVALRFDSSASWEFYRRLEAHVLRLPTPPNDKLETKHGKGLPGEEWADKIRELIKSCKIAVGDVTGCHGDVLFELGVAYGSGEPIIPAVEQEGNMRDCPFWLRRHNVASYQEDDGILSIATSIYDFFFGEQRIRPATVPQPLPQVFGYIGKTAWNGHFLDQAERALQHEALRLEGLDSIEDSNCQQALRLAARARILILSLDGTESDCFMHFACGMVAGHEHAGYGSKRLSRRVFLLTESPGVPVPESIVWFPKTIVAVKTDELMRDFREEISNYKQWIGG